MARTNGTDVKAILDTSLSAADLQPFIDDANLIVDEHLLGEGLSTALLTSIEKWLAAHLASMFDPRVSEEAVGDASFTYEGETGLGLDHTRYGQQVSILDPTGKLADAEAKDASFEVI